MIVSIFNENYIRPNSPRAWFLAARPKTLSGAAVPVMIGCAYAIHLAGLQSFQWVPAVLCFLFAFLMQIDSNLINDYYDCLKGRDNEERLGPLRACQQGWVTMKAMRTAILLTTVLACMTGAPLILFGGIQLVWVGIACVIFSALYTVCLAQLGLGDLLVLAFFGVVPVVFTCYCCVPPELQQYSKMPWLLSIATGLIVDTLLIVNNYRDIDNDRHSGKKTLVVLIGRKAAEYLYMVLITVALAMVLIEFGFSNTNLILCFGTYFFATSTWSKMRHIGKGKELNKVLGLTARNIFIYGVLTTVLILMDSFCQL